MNKHVCSAFLSLALLALPFACAAAENYAVPPKAPLHKDMGYARQSSKPSLRDIGQGKADMRPSVQKRAVKDAGPDVSRGKIKNAMERKDVRHSRHEDSAVRHERTYRKSEMKPGGHRTPQHKAAPAKKPLPREQMHKPAGPLHGNPATKIYHNSTCRYYRAHGSTVVFRSVREAQSRGFVPCRICGVRH